MSGTGSNTSSRRKDPTWKYAIKKSENDPYGFICKYCQHETNGGITRAKEHLVGTKKRRKNTKVCEKVPDDVKEEILAYVASQEALKQQKNMDYIPDFDANDDMLEIDEEPQVDQRRKRSVTSGKQVSSSASSYSLQKRKGPMDAYCSLNPELEVDKDERKKKLKQTSISEKLNVELRDQTWGYIADWFYEAGIPFNTVRLKSFKIMLKSIGSFGPTLPPPSYHHLRVPFLTKAVKATDAMLAEHREVWAKTGCSLMSDGWTDKRGRTLINFLVNSSHGTVFLKSVDASAYIKSADTMFGLLNKVIQEDVGAENVVQVITDNHSSMKAAGRHLEVEYPHLYWTPCAAHCLDLILEDFGKLSYVKRTLQRAMKLTGFIYAHGNVLNLMREFTNKRELLRPAMTRFATSFLTLGSIYQQKSNLRKMFTSEQWLKSKWVKEKDPKGREAMNIVMMPSFWNTVVFVIKSSSPLVRVLRLVDSEKKPAMKYVSSFRGSCTGSLGSFLDRVEFVWRCILSKQLKKFSAAMLGCMSVAILLAEATLLPSRVDLSLFSFLIKAVGKQEMLVQVTAFVPLVYMCICTYYSLFKIGMLMFYSLTPRQTSSVNLLMICSMVARYAPPISYNFLNLIRLGGDAKTIFEKRMGNIDDAVPFFGKGFNKIYPLIMCIYTVLVVSNFFGRVMDYFGSWKWFRFQNEAEDMNGFDPSGIIILQKERSWLEQGCKVGEQVIPLARCFNNTSADIESSSASRDNGIVEMKAADSAKSTPSKSYREDNRRYGSNQETLATKYAAIREQQQASRSSTAPSKGKALSSASVSLLDSDRSGNTAAGMPSGLASTWASMKTGLQSFKANIGAKKYIPLPQVQQVTSRTSSSLESLDDIFQRLKQKPSRDRSSSHDYHDDEDI